MYRKLHESLLDDRDIRIALVQKIMREGTVSVSAMGADHPFVSVEWLGVTGCVRDDGAYGPFDCETDYLDLWDDDAGQYHKEVPISYAADMIVKYLEDNYRRSLGMCAKED